MSDQPVALVLAELLETDGWPDAADELRRLSAENEAAEALLRQALERLEIWMDEHGCQRDRETISAIKERLGESAK
jgi:hemerythrin